MNSQVCDICRLTAAIGYCTCAGRYTYLCDQHVNSHVIQGGNRHLFKSLPNLQQNAEDAEDKCFDCRRPAVRIFVSQDHHFLLCEDHLEEHLLMSQDEVRISLPITAKNHLKNLSFDNLMKRKKTLEHSLDKFSENISRVDTCIREVTEKTEDLVESIRARRDHSIEQLSIAKEDMIAMLSRARTEVTEHMYDETYKSQDLMAALLIADSDQGLSDLLFRYTIDYDQHIVQEVIKVTFTVFPMNTTSGVPWIKKNCVKMYEYKSATWTAEKKLRGKIKIGKNSSVVVLPDSTLLACGRAPASSQVLNIDPVAYTVKELTPMHEKRSCPGLIVWLNSVYAFGGLYKRSCEKMCLSPELWSTLPAMSCYRSIFNPCAYQRKIFLCGGGSTTVESFDVVTNTFMTEPLTLPMRSHAYALIDSGQLLVFLPDRAVHWPLSATESSSAVTHRLNVIDDKCALRRCCFSSVNSLVCGRKVYIPMYYKNVLVCLDLDYFQVEKLSLS